MVEREQHISEFLRQIGWSDADVQTLAGDLSVRNFSRLTRLDGSQAILMDADPDIDRSTPAYVAMTEWLSACGLSVPKVYGSQEDLGLLLLEDFGDAKLTGLIQKSRERQRDYYHLAIEVLVVIRAAAPAALMQPSATQMVEATTLAEEWYPGANPAAHAQFRGVLETALENLFEAQAVVSLRDFHTDNVMWLEDRQGVRKLGLLDYQDAFLTHPVYDLMSLLTDARVMVPHALRAEMIEYYSKLTRDAEQDVTTAVAVLGAQRNLRILGIFARAARRYGKVQHLDSLARVHAYLSECLRHPVFSATGLKLSDMLPDPNPELVSGLRQ